jgi:hypothetical protein
MHSQLLAKKTPTTYKAYPLIIQLITKWEEYHNDPKFAPVKITLEAGFANTVSAMCELTWHRHHK